MLDIPEHEQVPCAHARDLQEARLVDIEQPISDLVALHDNVAALPDAAAYPEPIAALPQWGLGNLWGRSRTSLADHPGDSMGVHLCTENDRTPRRQSRT